jgi:hypothetical protein
MTGGPVVGEQRRQRERREEQGLRAEHGLDLVVDRSVEGVELARTLGDSASRSGSPRPSTRCIRGRAFAPGRARSCDSSARDRIAADRSPDRSSAACPARRPGSASRSRPSRAARAAAARADPALRSRSRLRGSPSPSRQNAPRRRRRRRPSAHRAAPRTRPPDRRRPAGRDRRPARAPRDPQWSTASSLAARICASHSAGASSSSSSRAQVPLARQAGVASSCSTFSCRNPSGVSAPLGAPTRSPIASATALRANPPPSPRLRTTRRRAGRAILTRGCVHWASPPAGHRKGTRPCQLALA